MFAALRGLFRRGRERAAQGRETAFAARFHRFRLFLSASLDAYSEMMSFEERLAAEEPFGMPFLRLCTARLTVASMQCVLQLNALGDGRFERLNEPFARLRAETQAILDRGALPVRGPLVLPYEDLGPEHADLAASSLCKLKAIRDKHPEYMPRGFVLTAAAWWRYFNDPDMHDEIDRIMVISQDDPSSYAEASASIRERMASSFPLPEDVAEAILAMRARYPELDGPGNVLLVRCLPALPEHAALVVPEQLLYTPVDGRALVEALGYALALSYRPRAILYRLKRGIRDRAMPLCVAVTLLPRAHARGSAHRRFESPESLFFHVRRGFSTPDSQPLQAADEKASLPEAVRSGLEQSIRAALDCLSDAPVRGKRHEVFWAASEQGQLWLTGVNALPEPLEDRTPPAGQTRPGEHVPPAGRILPEERAQSAEAALPDAEQPGNCLEGGMSTYPGQVRAPAFPVRNFTDALRFPLGHVLVIGSAIPRWTFLLDFASAVVAGDGTGNGLFARTARRYGRPAVLGQPLAFARLSAGDKILLRSSADAGCLIRPLPAHTRLPEPAGPPDGVPGAAFPLREGTEREGPEAPLWLPSSSMADMARGLARNIVPLTLPDSDHVDFRAENCRTFHDIINYCHVHAVQEMFRAGAARKSSSSPAKQLVCDVPKQFWIINLDDGFYGDIAGPVVRLEEIACLPMRSLWEGFTDKPWDGPPQLNAKGFLSVLFEASANPDLDPASQSTQYTEKNVFLVASRFCSMRCRFGFHFLSLDCLLGERLKERFIIFQFKGGAANLARRIRRVHFVAELLSQFEFTTEVVGDVLTARLEKIGEEEFLSAMRVLGYITMHTRQLDMIMGDEQALAEHRGRMLADMQALARRAPLLLP